MGMVVGLASGQIARTNPPQAVGQAVVEAGAAEEAEAGGAVSVLRSARRFSPRVRGAPFRAATLEGDGQSRMFFCFQRPCYVKSFKAVAVFVQVCPCISQF